MTGQQAPRPLPLLWPPPRRPRQQLPAPGRESAAGRPAPPKGLETGVARVSRPLGKDPQPHARPECKALTWPREESGRPPLAPGSLAAPARAPAWLPTLSWLPGRGASRGPCTREGGCGCWKEKPVGGRVGRRGPPRSWSGTQVEGAGECSRGRAREGPAWEGAGRGLALGKHGHPLARASTHQKIQEEPGITGEPWTQPSICLRPEPSAELSDGLESRSSGVGR